MQTQIVADKHHAHEVTRQSRTDIGRSASHTGVPDRFISLPKGPRSTRSASQGSDVPFSVEAIGMHYTATPPLHVAIPPRRSSLTTNAAPKHGKELGSPRFLPCRKASLSHLDTKLRVEISKKSPYAQHLEIAMEVAEEVARICNASEPLPTDVPLSAAGLTAKTAYQFERWLQARFEYHGAIGQLMNEDITPETLAVDILAACPSASPMSPWLFGEIPIMLDGSVDDLDHELSLLEHDLTPQSPKAIRRNLLPHKKLLLTHSANYAGSPSMVCPPILVSPPPPASPARKQSFTIKRDKFALRTTGFSGKKTGLAVGLLAVGALLSSPSRAGMEVSVPETPPPPSAFSAHFGISNTPDHGPFDHFEWSGSLTSGVVGVEKGERLSSWPSDSRRAY